MAEVERTDEVAHLLAAERAARAQDTALLKAGQALSATLVLREVFERILSELRNVVPYDTASVQELRGDQMVIVGGHGIDMDVFDGVGFDVTGDGVPNAEVLRRRRPVIVADILGDHPFANFPHDAHEMSGVRGWLGVPLLFGNECIGMLTLDTYQPDFYTERHAEVALAFAAQAAIALQNARAYDLARREVEERRRAEAELREVNEALRLRMAEVEALQESLREQAVRDDLTGLYNRRYFMERLTEEVRRSGSSGRPVAVALIDVDHFKAVNDSFGHHVGDRVLVAVAEHLLATAGDEAVVCRYGGEEFVVLLPGVDGGEAVDRAERWRSGLAGLDLANLDPPAVGRRDFGVRGGSPCPSREVTGTIDAPRVTASIGVAVLPGDGVGVEGLVRAADAAMYRAKAAGRDRVERNAPSNAPDDIPAVAPTG